MGFFGCPFRVWVSDLRLVVFSEFLLLLDLSLDGLIISSFFGCSVKSLGMI